MKLSIKQFIKDILIKYLGGIIILSLVLMILLSQPQNIDWKTYTSARTRCMGISGLLGMICIMRHAILSNYSQGVNAHKKYMQKIHAYLSVGVISSLLFHPLAVLITGGLSGFYLFNIDFESFASGRISIGKVSLHLLLIVYVCIRMSKKILKLPSQYWLHLMLYPLYGGIWMHAWFSGTMIANSPGVKIYRIAIGLILLGTCLRNIYHDIIFADKNTSKRIIHFSYMHI